MGRATTGPSSRTPRKLSSSDPLAKNGWTARAERYRVREYRATIRAEWFGDAESGSMRA